MNTQLPQQLDWDMAQNRWASLINPVLTNALVQGRLMTNVQLVNGANVVNHKLGRKIQGWIVVGINAPAQIYDNQATNQTPALTLALTSDADCAVSLWVF